MLEDKDEEEEESEVDESQRSQRERSTPACDIVMNMGWHESKRKHLEPMCDVQRMSVTTAKQILPTKTATLRACSRVQQVFFSHCTHCWVSCCASC